MRLAPEKLLLTRLILDSSLRRLIARIARRGIADTIAGPTSLDRISEATGIASTELAPVLGALASETFGLLESSGDTFTLTHLGTTLRDDHPHSMRGLCRLVEHDLTCRASIGHAEALQPGFSRPMTCPGRRSWSMSGEVTG
jgi:hypothetical protein